MSEREERHATVTPVRRRGSRWLRRLAIVLVLLVAAVGIGQWRLDLVDRWGLRSADPVTDPAGVAPPAGLELPEQPTAAPVAAATTPGRLRPGAVRRALAPYVDDPALRRHLDVVVADLDGHIVYRHGRGAITPASTTKLVTTLAALDSMDPMTRFETSVRRVPGTNRIVLVGGGDPFLASTAKAARGLYPHRATTATLAAETARALAAAGVHRVRLDYDASLFTGPAVNPAWPSTYVPEDVVPPIAALWVDEARGTNGRYVADPAAEAARVFAAQLGARGIQVRGEPRAHRASASAEPVARVQSAPLGEVVERILTVSDNNAAEVVLRHVGLAEGAGGSFTGGNRAVRAVLDRLGVSVAGLRLYDGSGLSRLNRLRPTTLVDVFRVAAERGRPELRQVLTGLPVAGFNGSLASRYGTAPAAGLGRVRVKTGTLTGVSGLAGLAEDLTGTPAIVIALADRVPVPQTMAARAALDRITAAVGACRCGAPE